MNSTEYKRGYDAGYKAALLDAIKQQGPDRYFGPKKIGGPDAPYRKLVKGPLP